MSRCEAVDNENLKRRQSTSRATASKTGSAVATGIGVAVSGTVVGDINLITGAPVRTRYIEQVLRIAPPELVGRDGELAEFAEFCQTASQGLPYLWWRGDPWAGKSALMSWFVLNPPPGIRVVSFFITARFASQDDRGAFIENVMEQLATLLDQPMPAYLTDSTRDAHMLGMLSDAAEACKARGDRLVLVVDGLDEDRGVTTGPYAHSIAALLPDPPPADMRIVVAGRPNPPIPTDVPQHHRLRDPAIARRLAPSPYAAVVRNDMEGELKRLLLGSETDQDTLGLLTAAGGGLSGPDLAELTDRATWQVNDELSTVTGRTFSIRPSRWLPDIRPDVYVLAHEELQETAKNYIGNARLHAYRSRLHAWANLYRERSWPDDTPEYLLRGYYRMLMAAGDLERMIACATDRCRHERMLSTSGGDDAALEEIILAMDVIARSDQPDLTAIARLAVFRDYLADRNTTIPPELPAAWAGLGQVKRAEALAGSIIHPGRHWLSLVELVKSLTEAGDYPQAERVAQSITHDGRRDEATMVLLRAAAAAEDIPAAEALLGSITSQGERTIGLIALAQAAIQVDNMELAKSYTARARSGLSALRSARRRGEALAAMAQIVAALGDITRAHLLIDNAEALVRSITQPSWQAAVWAALIRAAAAVDGPARALNMIDEAEAAARGTDSLTSQATALANLARAASAAGQEGRARSLISEIEAEILSIKEPTQQVAVSITLLRAAAMVEIDRTPELARKPKSPPDLSLI